MPKPVGHVPNEDEHAFAGSGLSCTPLLPNFSMSDTDGP
jgi:hypothetical protein